MINKKINNALWQVVLFILLPPITLIVMIEFAKVFFNMGESFYGGLIIVVGIVIFVAEGYGIYYKLKEAIQ